ncbi:MAG: RNA polymerase sigma factor [Actinomycetota bacterium]|nr:RNA polymerase sigma factor [Actinomycetota bacterium]
MADERAEMEAFCADAFPRLVGALALHTGDVHLAEELAQEALLRACRRWSTVGRMDSPGGWAYRVGVNLASNRFRRRAAARRAHQRLAAEGNGSEGGGDLSDAIAVRQALVQLTDVQRQAVILRFYFGMTAPQVADVTGSTAGAVRALIHRALATLREVLGPAVGVMVDEEAVDVP